MYQGLIFSLRDIGSQLKNANLSQLSKWLFQVGLLMTGVLMPLDIFTQGVQFLEILAFILMAQRAVYYIFINRLKSTTLMAQLHTVWPFVLPLVSFVISARFALVPALAWATLGVFVALVARGWLIAQFAEAEDIKGFVIATYAITIVLVGFGYFQFFGDILGVSPGYTLLYEQYRAGSAFFFPRVHSFALEPLYFSNYLLIPLSLMLAKMLGSKLTGWGKLGFVVTLALMLATNSRSAMLGFVIILLIVVVAEKANKLKIWELSKLILWSVALLATMILSVGVIKRSPTALSSFINHATDFGDPSARTRYQLWPQAFSGFSDRPILGIGPNNSRAYLNPEKFQSGADYRSLQPLNNDFLTILLEQGMIGILALLPLLVLIGKKALGVIRQHFHHPSSPYVLAIIAIAIQSNSFGAITLLRTWVVIGLLIASWRQADQVLS